VRQARQQAAKKVKAQAKKMSKDDARHFEQQIDTAAKNATTSIDKVLDEKVEHVEKV
jgi:ribosome recycling factor